MKRVVISALALSLSLVAASTQAADEQRPKGDREGRLLERFDTNKDGKLDDAERAKAKEAMAERRKDGGGGPRGEEFRAKMLEKYDANKDGKLDDAEKAKAREEFAKNGPRREPSPEMKARMLEKYDANKDGKLDDAEKAKAHEEFRKDHPGGRRPGGKPGEKTETKSETKPEEKK